METPVTIERSIFINAARERVWRALTRPEELSAWFDSTVDGVIAPGEVLNMKYGEYPYQIRIDVMEPPERFAWSWVPGMVDWEANLETEPLTQVTFTLVEEAGGTRVTVIESGFDRIALARRAKAYEENTEGWKIQLERLAKYASKAA